MPLLLLSLLDSVLWCVAGLGAFGLGSAALLYCGLAGLGWLAGCALPKKEGQKKKKKTACLCLISSEHEWTVASAFGFSALFPFLASALGWDWIGRDVGGNGRDLEPFKVGLALFFRSLSYLLSALVLQFVLLSSPDLVLTFRTARTI